MKPLIWSILVLVILLAACSPSSQAAICLPPPNQAGWLKPRLTRPASDLSDRHQGYPAPPYSSPISWDEAKGSITGKVTEVISSLVDRLLVLVTDPLNDGRAGDRRVLAEIEACGSLCEKIEVITSRREASDANPARRQCLHGFDHVADVLHSSTPNSSVTERSLPVRAAAKAVFPLLLH